VIDASTGTEIFRAGDGVDGQRVFYLPNKSSLAVVCGQQLKFYGADGKPTTSLSRLRAGIGRVVFSPDGGRIVSTGPSNAIRIFDTDWRRELFQRAGHVNGVSQAVLSPDNRTLVTHSLDNTIKVWNLDRSLDPPALGDGEYGDDTWVPALTFDHS